MKHLSDAGPEMTGRTDRWAKFRGLRRWQLLLSLLPATLLAVGGAVGGGIGVAGVFANLSLARKEIGTPLKVLVMMGVVVASYLVYFALAGLFYYVTRD